MTFELKLYDKIKYRWDSKGIYNILYKDIVDYQVVWGKEAKKLEQYCTPDNIDDYHEYLVLEFKDGTTSTFRNSYVDLIEI